MIAFSRKNSNFEIAALFHNREKARQFPNWIFFTEWRRSFIVLVLVALSGGQEMELSVSFHKCPQDWKTFYYKKPSFNQEWKLLLWSPWSLTICIQITPSTQPIMSAGIIKFLPFFLRELLGFKIYILSLHKKCIIEAFLDRFLTSFLFSLIWNGPIQFFVNFLTIVLINTKIVLPT